MKIRLFAMSCKLPFWQQEVCEESYSAIQCSILFSSILSCLMVCVLLPLHLGSAIESVSEEFPSYSATYYIHIYNIQFRFTSVTAFESVYVYYTTLE